MAQWVKDPGHSCGSDLISGLGTSICVGAATKRKEVPGLMESRSQIVNRFPIGQDLTLLGLPPTAFLLCVRHTACPQPSLSTDDLAPYLSEMSGPITENVHHSHLETVPPLSQHLYPQLMHPVRSGPAPHPRDWLTPQVQRVLSAAVTPHWQFPQLQRITLTKVLPRFWAAPVPDWSVRF